MLTVKQIVGRDSIPDKWQPPIREIWCRVRNPAYFAFDALKTEIAPIRTPFSLIP